MYLDRICKICKNEFKGGPRAFYCPSCRIEKQREYNIRSKRNARKGTTRTIGSSDICERCGGEYIINGPNQKFCKECQKPHYMEYDKKVSLEYYHKNKDRINPKRNARRRVKKSED